MNISLVRKLYKDRRMAVEQIQTLYSAAEGRDLTADEQATEATLQATIDDLGVRIDAGLAEIERAESMDEQAERMAALDQSDVDPPPAGDQRTDEELLARMRAGELRVAEFMPEKRDLTAGTATDGAELIPTTLWGQLYVQLRENATVLNSGARTLNTASGEQFDFPTVTSFSTASIVAEAAAIPESDPQFGTVSIDAYKYGFLVQVSSELEQDEIVNLGQFLAEQGGDALGRGIGAHLVTGTGSGQPNGVVNTTNANNQTAASATAIAADELFDMQHSLISGYRSGAAWLVKDSTVQALRKLQDTTNQYLWQPGLTMGAPDTLLGSPVLIDDGMAAIATTNISMVYGNFARGYIVRFAGGVRLDRSTDYAFNTDLATYRFLLRADGEIIDHNAIVKLTQA